MRETILDQWSRLSIRGKLLFVVGILLAALYFSWPWLQSRLLPPAPDAAPTSATTPDSFTATDMQWATFTIAPAKSQTFRDERDADAKVSLDADHSTAFISPFSGRVVRVFVNLGDHVVAGQPLYSIAASEFVQGENDLISAAATLNSAKSAETVAEQSETRAHAVYEAKGGALKDWEQAKADLSAAQAARRTAEVALGAARDRLQILGLSLAQIGVIESTPTAAQFVPTVDVVAPVSGVITQRQLSPGDLINSAATGGASVLTIADLSRVWVEGMFRDDDVSVLHAGDAVVFTPNALGGRSIQGKVTVVAPTVDPTTHRVLIRAALANDDGALKPEMFGRLRVIASDSPGHGGTSDPAVPDSAVIFEGPDAHIWVANPAKKSVSLRPIQLGRHHDDVYEVTSGLKDGEMVITKGAMFIDRATKGD